MLPTRLWSRAEVLASPSAVPIASGIYGWYFSQTPPGVPVEGTYQLEGWRLLYVGISPSGPERKATLRRRLRTHFRSDASRSTLRRSLGCLLRGQLELELRPRGRSGRTHFGPGEDRLSDWMGGNAAVVWLEHERPWDLERALLRELVLPLNIQNNPGNSFAAELKALRTRVGRNPLPTESQP